MLMLTFSFYFEFCCCFSVLFLVAALRHCEERSNPVYELLSYLSSGLPRCARNDAKRCGLTTVYWLPLFHYYLLRSNILSIDQAQYIHARRGECGIRNAEFGMRNSFAGVDLTAKQINHLQCGSS